jgi:hypothetical protein
MYMSGPSAVLLAVVSFDASLICKFGLEKDWRCVCKFKVRSPEDNRQVVLGN